MLSEKFSTNPDSFIKFGRGRRIGWRLHMDTPIYIYIYIKYGKIIFENYLCIKTKEKPDKNKANLQR